jgi:hypothetical protein
VKIRLTGPPTEVETAAARIAGVLTVLEIARPYPRCGNSAQVSLSLDALDAPVEGASPAHDTPNGR